MKTLKHRCVALFFILIGVNMAIAHAAPENIRTINVSGQAEIKVAPDEVVIQVGVESRNKVLAGAKRQNDEAIARILSSVRQFGVEKKHVQTGYISVEPVYESRSSKVTWSDETRIEHYRVRKDVAVVLRDVSKFEALLSALLDDGANRVNGVKFNTTELRKHRDRARQLAIIAAREKAQALAGELGQKIGKAISINENGFGSVFGNAAMNAVQDNVSLDNVSGNTVALGQISVTATVNVQFELQ